MKKFFILSLICLWLVTCGVARGSPPEDAKKAPKQTPEMLAEGKKLYTIHCATCHGDKGDGKGPSLEGLKAPPRNFTEKEFNRLTTVVDIFNMMTKGVRDSEMVSFGYLPEKDRWAIATYIKSFKAAQ